MYDNILVEMDPQWSEQNRIVPARKEAERTLPNLSIPGSTYELLT